ncbi:MAG: hypothetical protein ACFB5Z_09280 [Elainellaceae cyanobacterium]
MAYRERGKILELMPHLRLTIIRLGGSKTVDGYRNMMQDVCQQWG